MFVATVQDLRPSLLRSRRDRAAAGSSFLLLRVSGIDGAERDEF
ncbi:hypothetical protein [Nonomuraea sp. NPDC049625]